MAHHTTVEITGGGVSARLGLEHNTLYTDVNTGVSSGLQDAPIRHDRKLNKPSIVIPGIHAFIREGDVVAIAVDVGICGLCGSLPDRLTRARDAPRIGEEVFYSLLHRTENVGAASVLKTKSGVAADPFRYFSYIGRLARV
jgi:hypothetical protein